MKILDVGGGHNTKPDATHVIDIIQKPDSLTQSYVRKDICLGNWPYPDNYFDFVYCTETLEDLRDPLVVCKELVRVAKKGEITCPGHMTELTRGVDNWPGSEKHAGFTHHRWIVYFEDGILNFLPKWAMVHVFPWVEKQAKMQRLRFTWSDNFVYQEVLVTDWYQYYNVIARLTGNPLYNEGWLKTLECDCGSRNMVWHTWTNERGASFGRLCSDCGLFIELGKGFQTKLSETDLIKAKKDMKRCKKCEKIIPFNMVGNYCSSECFNEE